MNRVHFSPEAYSLNLPLKAENQNITGAKLLVDEQAIFKTYSKEEQFSCKKYAEYLKLIKENPSFGYKRCAKLLGVPAGRTRWWHTKGEKKAIPHPLRVVQKLKSAGMLPFTEKHEHAETILRMLGVLFGDGGIDIRLNTMAFISADKRDVDLWKKDLLEIFPYAKNKMNLIEGGEYGHSYNIRTFDRSIIRFFVALGTPVGDKIITKYSLPSNFNSLPEKLRSAFLDGLISSEVSVPKFVETVYQTNYFKNFSFSLSKTVSLEESHIKFMKSLKRQLKRLKIDCTKAVRKDVYRKELRKDGHRAIGYRIFFSANIPNVLRFNEQFPLKYCHGKKERFNQRTQKAINVELKRERQFKQELQALNSKEEIKRINQTQQI